MSLEQQIFSEASDLPPPDRAVFLDRACAGHPGLRERVLALLFAHDHVGTFLSRPPTLPVSDGSAVWPADLPRPAAPGQKINHYKLLKELGEGGCGVVFLAEQEEPVRRLVALKIIKLGMDTREVIARFEAERQALALMDHPGIARVFDAGATDLGRPFFVMELVQGVPITDFCDQHQLSIRERLELFIHVCHALLHAHQKGIIHRDLKPSNVLVTTHDDLPMPKVIDFGIAKATGGRLTDKTMFTAVEQFLGTPMYMSPEQAGQGSIEIDARSDIYSLGVLLYELLTGLTPFDAKALRDAPVDEVRRRVREVEPPTPSARLGALDYAALSESARRRGLSASKFLPLVRGDLDWIVMKCLEKDRQRRYLSAQDLALDVERHLRDQPVLARRPGVVYLCRKFLRRHRVPVSVSLAIALALLAGVAVRQFWDQQQPAAANPASASIMNSAVDRPQLGNPPLASAAPYLVPADQVVTIDLSVWAGYAGFIVANGGLEPTENSYFFQKFGFKVRLVLDEEDMISRVNNGKYAASVTTVDVLAVQSRDLRVVVPAQIDFSRGGDGVVVRAGLNSVPHLAGRVLATSQFTESDFYIRDLARHAHVPVALLDSLDSPPNPAAVNLAFCKSTFDAGDLLLFDLQNHVDKLAGVVTWEPKISELLKKFGGNLHELETNQNDPDALRIADVLIVNQDFARQHPPMVRALVEGLLEGNRLITENPEAQLAVVSKAFQWPPDVTRAQLHFAHFSNLPENLAFFQAHSDQAPSFQSIYRYALDIYRDLISDAPDASRFVDASALQEISSAGLFQSQAPDPGLLPQSVSTPSSSAR